VDGLLVIDKPAGWTSHDVVARVRRLTGVRRVGHAGTLDPAATGVLPLGIGQGTRVLEYLSDAGKSYRAVVRLGATTDTDDAEGTPLLERDWRHVTAASVRETLAGFVGAIEQVPPAYSAIKRGGVPLYRLARSGADVRPAARRVRIDRIDVLDVSLPDVTLQIDCSKGTYIRSLARDAGETLGCGGHLVALRRLRSGPLSLVDAHRLEDVAAAAAAGALEELLLPPDVALLTSAAIVVGADAERRLLTGQELDGHGDPDDNLPVRAYAADGAFLAVVQATAHGTWKPYKVFTQPHP
jgi:tRNA pseudouridine55 synthase